jgi:hypothetical protein
MSILDIYIELWGISRKFWQDKIKVSNLRRVTMCCMMTQMFQMCVIQHTTCHMFFLFALQDNIVSCFVHMGLKSSLEIAEMTMTRTYIWMYICMYIVTYKHRFKNEVILECL